MSSYCYVGRYNSDKVYVNTNTEAIFNSVNSWVQNKPWPKIPNQQHNTYYLADIGCSTDLPLKQKYIDLPAILASYDASERLNSTFATKYPSMLKLDVRGFKKKPRVRISLMPQYYSYILEPKTDFLRNRLRSIDRLQQLGWEVHLNFSPIVCYPGWLKEYEKLFRILNIYSRHSFDKSTVKCECIFMTSHKNTQERISEDRKELMKYVTEQKNPQGVLRYPIKYKRTLQQQFIDLHQELIPWCEIRYIF